MYFTQGKGCGAHIRYYVTEKENTIMKVYISADIEGVTGVTITGMKQNLIMQNTKKLPSR